VVVLVMVLVAGLVTGCSSGSGIPDSEAPPVTDAASAVWVTIGGIETLNTDRDDIRDNWTQLVFAEQMAPGGVHVNVATEDATVESALDGQLSKALVLRATVVTIWLESADLQRGTPPATYEQQLTSLVEGLQREGVHVYLLRGGPATDEASPLHAAIAAVADRTGSTLVDLGDVTDRTDDAGQRAIADVVGPALAPDLGS
jgi:hypothetical protein